MPSLPERQPAVKPIALDVDFRHRDGRTGNDRTFGRSARSTREGMLMDEVNEWLNMVRGRPHGAVYHGLVPDTDPMYRRGWSIVSGSSTERSSIKDLMPADWKDKTSEMRGKTITIIGAPHPGRAKPKPSE